METYQFWSRAWHVAGLVVCTGLVCLFLVMAIAGCGGANTADRVGALAMALVMSAWVWYARTMPYAAEVTGDGLLVLQRLAGELRIPIPGIRSAAFHSSKGGRLILLLLHAEGKASLEARAPQVHELVEGLLKQNPGIEVTEGRVRWPWTDQPPNGRERLRKLARQESRPWGGIFRL